MAEPNALSLSPVIYKARGVVIDTRLRVFDTDFHLSSTVLKMNSQYFDRYLDSADKTPQGHAGRLFKYEWTTKIVDEGGDWQLVCEGPNAGDLNLSNSKVDKVEQSKAFKNILDAMYHQPYILGDAKEILTMTNLARFYMALPTVSRSLHRALQDSTYNINQDWIRDNPCDMLTAAYALRHTELYKNALIWCLGPYEKPVLYQLKDRALRLSARCQYFKLRYTILGSLEIIFCGMIEEYNECMEDDNPKNITMKMVIGLVKATVKHMERADDGSLKFPALFQTLSHMKVERMVKWTAKQTFTSLVRSGLSFGCGKDCTTGDGPCEDYFLFSTVDNADDLPWDPEETEW